MQCFSANHYTASKEKVKDKDKERFYTIFPKWIQCNIKNEIDMNSNNWVLKYGCIVAL